MFPTLTLRLLSLTLSSPQVAKLAREGQFDYLVIESTGIAEPMQVAETFAFNADQESPSPAGPGVTPLQDLARLDTCVTVVDAASLWENFASLETLKDREDKGGEGEKKGPKQGSSLMSLHERYGYTIQKYSLKNIHCIFPIA